TIGLGSDSAVVRFKDLVVSRPQLFDEITDGSGFKEIWLGINEQPAIIYQTQPQSISFPAEGVNTIKASAGDNLKNTSQEKRYTIAVDNTAPRTDLFSSENYYQHPTLTEVNYAPQRAIYHFESKDIEGKDKVLSGLRKTGFRVKGQGLSDDWNTYTEPFILSEGKMTVEYYSVDNVQNAETVHTKQIWVDGTAPQSTLEINTPKYITDSKTFITGNTGLKLTATDLEVLGVASGVEMTEYRYNNDNWIKYTGEFKLGDLIEGNHTIDYRSQDNVGNLETHKSVTITIDNTPPETTISVLTPKYSTDDKLWVTGYTSFTLTATDKGLIPSGTQYMEYKVDETIWQRYTQGWSLSNFSEGEHTIYFRSSDNLNNLEVEKTLKVIIDNSAPATSVSASEPKYQEYINSLSTWTLTATDLGAIPCGVQKTGYRVQGQGLSDDLPWTVIASPPEAGVAISSFTITGADGIYTIEYYSVDNVENTEIVKSSTVKLDNTPPVTTLTINGGKQWTSEDGKLYASLDTQYVLTAEDPLVNGVASGVKEIFYSIDSTRITHYSLPITLTEGIHTIQYWSYDNVLNQEQTKSLTVYVDNTAPVTTLNVGQPQCVTHGEPQNRSHTYTVINSNTPLTLIASDPVISDVSSGVKEIYYSINSSPFTTYASPFALSGPDGDYTVGYYSIDNVGNYPIYLSTSLPSYPSTLTLDNTPPVTTIILPANTNEGLCRIVSGNTPVIGTVSDLHFKWYQVAYAPVNSNQWSVISEKIFKEVTEGILTTWDTSVLADGWYTIKLTAQDCVTNETSTTVDVYVGKPDLTLQITGFNKPSYVALDSTENIYVSDTNNDRVKKYDSSGNLLLTLTGIPGNQGKGQGKGQGNNPDDLFNKPQGVAVDTSSNIYVADRNNDRVIKYDSQGNHLLTITGFNKPHGLATDSQDNLYVADRNNNRIQKYDSAGILLLTIGTTIPDDGLNKPQGVIAIGSAVIVSTGGAKQSHNNCLYITDRNNDRVLIYTSTGGYITQISSSSGLNKPDGITVNKQGYIYVSDTNNNT
ncbi:MAG: NHL repeat-containing protein, partial [Candidatus Auribacterota bacterium]